MVSRRYKRKIHSNSKQFIILTHKTTPYSIQKMVLAQMITTMVWLKENYINEDKGHIIVGCHLS